MTALRAAAALLLVTAMTAIAFVRQERFPHEQHARLFPLCTGCHEGIPSGDATRSFPAPQLCAGCHNGSNVRRVNWSGPHSEASNLKFSHPEHLAATPDLECSDCHTREGADRMAVQHAVAERCLACHEPEARNHYVDTRCETCHVPVAQSRFTLARLEALPVPPTHTQPNFLEELHGELARSSRAQCVICHTRERCAACHVDAGARAEIQAMPAAPSDLRLPVMRSRYFLPPSHTRPDWLETHGAATRNIAACASCHTRESCATCHAANAPKAVRALPARSMVVAQGVTAARRAPASHAAPFFTERHGAQAAAKAQSCTSCHTRNECEQCHNAAATGRAVTQRMSTPSSNRSRSFHPSNFLARHASAAYGRNLECANCHETSRFCRDCHEGVGMGTTGRLQPGFHDAQPLWLLNHGKPARQGLESCASCHKQTDCLQCHSTIGAFRISPHGPGFDASKVQSKNARICFACHLSNPLERPTP